MTDNRIISGIGQIAIAVSDLDRAMEFYRDVLELEFLFTAPAGAAAKLAFFNCGGVRLMLTTPQGAAADHATSVIYYQVNDLDAANSTLSERGVEFVQQPQMVAQMSDHELWMGFIRDPDNHLIGIMAERPLGEPELISSAAD